MNRRPVATVLAFSALLAGGGSLAARSEAPPKTAQPAVDSAYLQEMEAWRKDRNEELKQEDSWFTLVGLFWLEPGENRFGSGPDNRVILPEGKAPAVAGTLIREGDAVKVRVAPGAAVTSNGQPVTEAALTADAQGKPTVLELGSLSFFVIQRGDKVGVRVKDSRSPALTAFRGLDFYPVQPGWKVDARFEPYNPPKPVPVPNILGQVSNIPSPGAVVFDWQGQTYRLDALQGSPDGGLSLIFADTTNGKETYGAGRFLDTTPPKDGRVVVDFNTAYNPPCAYTSFATCPLPPVQNRLTVAVAAGEKKYEGGPEH